VKYRGELKLQFHRGEKPGARRERERVERGREEGREEREAKGGPSCVIKMNSLTHKEPYQNIKFKNNTKKNLRERRLGLRLFLPGGGVLLLLLSSLSLSRREAAGLLERRLLVCVYASERERESEGDGERERRRQGKRERERAWGEGAWRRGSNTEWLCVSRSLCVRLAAAALLSRRVLACIYANASALGEVRTNLVVFVEKQGSCSAVSEHACMHPCVYVHACMRACTRPPPAY
jgi:hypothetical protein